MISAGGESGGDTPGATAHISPTSLRPQWILSMRELVPGGYLFTHLVFWSVIGLVAVGTNAVAIILSVGLGLLVVEALGKVR